MVPLQGPCCIRTRQLENRKNDKDMLTDISVTLGKLLPCLFQTDWLDPYSVLRQSTFLFVSCNPFRVLTCPSVCALQSVSAPRSVGFFPCPDLSVHLCSPGSECPSLGWILSMSCLVCPSALSSL